MIYELEAICISIKLALITMAILLLIGTPLAWWLANSSSRIKPFIEALVAMPLVLPPTVLGFYLLIILGPAGKIGSFSASFLLLWSIQPPYWPRKPC